MFVRRMSTAPDLHSTGAFLFLFFLSVFKPPINTSFNINVVMVVLCVFSVLTFVLIKINNEKGVQSWWREFKTEILLLLTYTCILLVSLVYNAHRYSGIGQFVYHGIAPVVIWCVFPLSIYLFANTNSKLLNTNASTFWGWILLIILALIAIWQKVDPESAALLTYFFVASDADFGYVNINSLMRINTDFGSLMAVSVIASLSGVVFSKKAIVHNQNLLLLFCAALFLVAGTISGSRNFILSAVMGGGVVMGLFFRHHPIKVFMGALALLFSLHVSMMQSNQMLAKYGSMMPYAYKLMEDKPLYEIDFELSDFKPNIDLTGRDELWERAFDLWQSSPILGVTGGGFKLASQEENPINNTHNYLIQVLVDGGILALLAMALLLYQLSRRISPSQYGVIAAIATSLMFDNFLDHSLPWIFAMAWLIAVTGNMHTEKEITKLKDKYKRFKNE